MAVYTRKFKYNQWDVQLEGRRNGNFHFVKVSCDGGWFCVNGSLYAGEDCVRYDYPDSVPQGLKDKINKVAHKMLAQLEF